jgi:3-deoxy-manno-octulosonate cytidylyltransferase (CMP-KDO synthetase)
VAAVAQNMDNEEIFCNIQADEPFIDPAIIDEAIAPLANNLQIGFSTVMHSVDHEDGYKDPGVVKTVIDKAGFGLYFSRSQIPYPRTLENYKAYEHLGVYVYRKDALLRFVQWPVSPLEKMESLEMLRILDNDEKIYVAVSNQPFYALSVDTPEDLEKANEIYKTKQAK